MSDTKKCTNEALSIIKVYSDFLLKKEELIFTQALRVNAIPPIKGKITKGKLKWRGIKKVVRNHMFAHESWLEQRGKKISEVFSYGWIVD